MIDERILTASEGMVYTNGETYGKVIYLGVTDNPANWWEVPEDEMTDELATEEDYLAALDKLGVN